MWGRGLVVGRVLSGPVELWENPTYSLPSTPPHNTQTDKERVIQKEVRERRNEKGEILYLFVVPLSLFLSLSVCLFLQYIYRPLC